MTRGVIKFVLERVSGQRGVVGFNVQFEMVNQTVLQQERMARLGVVVVLVSGRLTGLGLDVELPFESQSLLVLHRQVQQPREVFPLPAHVGVQQCVVALASTPEDVPRPAQPMRHFDGFLHLGCRVGEHIHTGTGARPAHVSGMGEQARGSPEQTNTGGPLQTLGVIDHLVKLGIGLGKIVALGGNVTIVEAPERRSQLGDKFKHGVHGLVGRLHFIVGHRPGHHPAPHPKRIGSSPAHGMPVAHRKPQVIPHGFSRHHFIRVVVREGQRVVAVWTFVGNVWDVLEPRRG